MKTSGAFKLCNYVGIKYGIEYEDLHGTSRKPQCKAVKMRRLMKKKKRKRKKKKKKKKKKKTTKRSRR